MFKNSSVWVWPCHIPIVTENHCRIWKKSVLGQVHKVILKSYSPNKEDTHVRMHICTHTHAWTQIAPHVRKHTCMRAGTHTQLSPMNQKLPNILLNTYSHLVLPIWMWVKLFPNSEKFVSLLVFNRIAKQQEWRTASHPRLSPRPWVGERQLINRRRVSFAKFPESNIC